MLPYTEHNFHRLKQQMQQECTRIYQARGILLKRCEKCRLAVEHCICEELPRIESACNLIVIFHHDEVFKPTNSGRLIGEAFPANTHVFAWDRLQPDTALLELLNQSDRQPVVVFPLDQGIPRQEWQAEHSSTNKKLTFVLLDGTWRQARRMFNASRWLSHLPVLNLSPEQQAKYITRKAFAKHYLSTAESTALALDTLGFAHEAVCLLETFDLFNDRYAKIKTANRSNNPSS